MPPFPSFTKTWHSTSYPAIDASKPELSAKGKVVVITGGAGIIGTAIARSFARAQASAIILTGRTKKTLEAAKDAVQTESSGANVHYYVSDTTDSAAVKKTMTEIHDTHGAIDVLVSNAGYLASAAPVVSIDHDDFWKSMEINVRGSFNVIQAFLLHGAKEGAALVNISAGLVHTTKLIEFVQTENPGLHVLNVHPGVIKSPMTEKLGVKDSESFSLDKAQLPGDFVVWTTSGQAGFLKGKFVWANWDVSELIEQAEEIQKGSLLSLGLDGLPTKDDS